jgi:hypothetical protein
MTRNLVQKISDIKLTHWSIDNSSSHQIRVNFLGHPLSDQSFLRSILQEQLQHYRSLTRIHIHNGRSTSFGFDDWLPADLLSLHFPTLFSHSTTPYSPVASSFFPSLAIPLHPRLTSAACDELDSLHALLRAVWLDEEHDVQIFTWDGSTNFSAATYRAVIYSGDENPNGKII